MPLGVPACARVAALLGRTSAAAVTLSMVLLLTPLEARDGFSEPDWSYSGERGPEHWGTLSPAYAACAEGELQSPIDIRDAQPMPFEPLVFQYRSQPMVAEFDGRLLRLLSPSGSELRLRGERFALEEVHFHVPGEHQIKGVSADGEIHFVHRGRAGRQLIVAVRVIAGRRPNTVLARVLDDLPASPGDRVRRGQVGINPLFLLPADKSHFTYTGSMDTPPCSEPVTWMVMAQPLELEAGQVRKLARLTGSNARPVQPLNGRGVLYMGRR